MHSANLWYNIHSVNLWYNNYVHFLHREQYDREQALDDFKTGLIMKLHHVYYRKIGILIAYTKDAAPQI